MITETGYKQELSSRDLNLLTPEFKAKAEELLENCKKRGANLRPFFTLRGPMVQAKLWRQSRSIEEITRALEVLKTVAPKMMKILKEVGPQTGKWATNALPGQSWHQWGEAIDCYVLNTIGQVVWSSQHPGYAIYAEEAKRLEMDPGHYWPNKDSVHVQLRKKSVRDLYTWPEIEVEMAKRFNLR